MHDPAHEADIFTIVSSLPLRRLATDLCEFFPGVDNYMTYIGLPFFSHLTHLDMLDDSESQIERLSPLLIRLPVLTHLALAVLPLSSIIQRLLEGCLHLQVLVILWEAFHSRVGRTAAAEITEHVSDPRFVMTIYHEWDEGVRLSDWDNGASTYWYRAQSFIASKRRQDIPMDCFWAED
ncbi:hypothetical protein MIND_00186700 [Mycena indigotica]|uniref:Uncharacterized protein n=1 Tax=Mycena indigotica TaxID=2126181 RepID=A0A8H6WEE4_9AGAR|nr:uncharacterized protein MIND_00186700 [Mycena indigotica]KAF7311763.1 hypothetical protein MIND_00186700 [Mycena indigotica]